jgi:peroxiredoxin
MRLSFLFFACCLSGMLFAQTTTLKKVTVNGVTYEIPVKEYKKEFPYEVSLKDKHGNVVKSSEVLQKNGKPTILLFWLTTCVPCSYEIAAIEKKYANWKTQTDFNFYAISIDLPGYEQRFFERVNQSSWILEAYLDYERVFSEIMPGELNGAPQTFVLDKNGKIVYHKRKYTAGDEDLLFDEVLILNTQ